MKITRGELFDIEDILTKNLSKNFILLNTPFLISRILNIQYMLQYTFPFGELHKPTMTKSQ